MKKTSEEIEALMLRVMVFVDRHGVVLSKTSNPMSTSLKMSYQGNDLDVIMRAYAHSQGNGSCGATVKLNDKIVFKASGTFRTEPSDVEASIYKPGDWEDKFPEVD